ncbi:MAG: TIGR00296 family protein [Thermoplasmata archaeon]
MFSHKEGEIAVKAARDVVDSYVEGKKVELKKMPQMFQEKMGVFVTINKHPSGDLRGCIGYPEPIMSLKDALIRSTASATSDPRFPPLSKDELDHVIIEVTLLTSPKEIECKPEELTKNIRCGRDGLIVSYGNRSGLLLPQVPVEQGWDVREFLDHTCMKAGVPSGTWKKKECSVKKFQGEIFKEKEPRGEVVRKEL